MPNDISVLEQEAARREFARLLRDVADGIDADPTAFEAAAGRVRDNAQVVMDAFAALPRRVTVDQRRVTVDQWLGGQPADDAPTHTIAAGKGAECRYCGSVPAGTWLARDPVEGHVSCADCDGGSAP